MKSALLSLLLAAGPQPEIDPAVVLPALDHQKLLVADQERRTRGEPVHYAVPHKTSGLALAGGGSVGGRWEAQPDGTWRWRGKVVATGASSVDVGFFDYWLPQGAELYVTDAGGKVRHGPYTDRHNRSHGQLWTPVVPGEVLRLELTVPDALREHVRFEVGQVNYGYRFFNEEAVAKALSCNVDVACPEGDPYRDEIRSVATYTVGAGGGVCSGALVNNAREDSTPYFLTAEHCDVSAQLAPSLVFYFNYESETCRSGNESGMMLPRSIADTISGSTLVAGSTESDFLLLELSEAPAPEFRVHYAGWDRRDQPAEMVVGIHHPRTHEKRLAIEFDPVVDGNATVDFFGRPRLGPFTWWEVREWDVGITEQGSSGSPIFNQDRRIVGQLAGGAFFSCPGAEEGSDFYGKMSVSWDAGASHGERLADWLDPLGTGVEVLNGFDGCEAPEVTAEATAALLTAGQTVGFSVSASGGQGPYTYAWDLEGDGGTDSTLQAPEARYPDLPRNPVTGEPTESVNVTVTVTDATGCAARDTIGLVIRAPRIELAASAPVEACGDGDAAIEAGEIWSFPVRLTNTGNVTATGAVAAFGRSTGDSAAKASGGPDAFGYTFRDSEEGFCAFTEVDLSGGTALTPDPAGPFDANDDGGADLTLGGAPFSFYGQGLTQLEMATNGYLATDLSDDGADFDNDCPLPQAPDTGGGARIMPFHDDLVVRGGLYHDFYETCPRPADVGDPGQSCNAFQWDDVEFFDVRPERFSLQAFLYAESRQLAFQYLGDDPTGSGATVGIQNAAASDALQVSCNQAGRVAPGRAVCIYHPEAGPPEASDAFILLNPTVELGDLAPGESADGEVAVLIDEGFPCGDAISIDYLGASHDLGFSNTARAGALTAQVAAGAACASSAPPCALPLLPDFQPRTGFWFNALRSGNGIDLHFAGAQLYGAWYTARRDGRPTWYYLQSRGTQRLESNQVQADLLSFVGPVGNPSAPPAAEVVGAATLSFVSPDRALISWTLDGERRGELIRFFDLAEPGPVTPVITDQWFNVGESGWGVAVQQQDQLEFSAIYFYGTDDLPAWVVTLEADRPLLSGESTVGALRVHCPGCVWATPELFEAGTLRRTFDAATQTGVLDLSVDTDRPVPIVWDREGLPIRTIQSLGR